MDSFNTKLIEKLLALKDMASSDTKTTFFSVIGREYDEDLISRVVAYLLENDFSLIRNLIDYYQKKKCDVPLDTDNIFDITVKCERVTDNGRMDIFVIAEGAQKRVTLTIENKIRSWEHEVSNGVSQTDEYYQAISSEYHDAYNTFFYLKPDWNESKPANDSFLILTYSMLSSFIGETTDPIILDFQNHIKEFLGEEAMVLSEKDVFLITNYKEIVNQLSSFEKQINSVKQSLVNEINQGLEAKLNGPIPEWTDQLGERLSPEDYYFEKANYNSKVGLGSYRVSKRKWFLKGNYYLYVEILFENGLIDNNTRYQCTLRRDSDMATQTFFENTRGKNNAYRAGKYYVFYKEAIKEKAPSSLPEWPEWKESFIEEAVNRIPQLIQKAEEAYNLYLYHPEN